MFLVRKNVAGPNFWRPSKLQHVLLINFLISIQVVAVSPAAQADGQGPPFAKVEGTAVPANIVEVAPGKTEPGSVLPCGQCWVWAAQKGAGYYKTWPWRKFGPFQLTGGTRYILAFSGSVVPAIDTTANPVKLKPDESQLGFKNPLTEPFDFVVEKGASQAAQETARKCLFGKWQWFDGFVTFFPNGTCRHSDTDTGTWTLDADRTLRISWANGWFANAYLSKNGMAVKGVGSTDPHATRGQDLWGKKLRL